MKNTTFSLRCEKCGSDWSGIDEETMRLFAHTVYQGDAHMEGLYECEECEESRLKK